jgi:uncharacterized protein (DUF1778 family)
MPLPRAPRLSFAVNTNEVQQRVILAAAQQRSMSMASFVRRSALAVAVHDLDLDWVALMHDEQPTRGFAEGIDQELGRLQGFGRGAWKIVSMEEYRRAD